MIKHKGSHLRRPVIRDIFQHTIPAVHQDALPLRRLSMLWSDAQAMCSMGK